MNYSELRSKIPTQHLQLIWRALEALGIGVAVGVITFTLVKAVPIYARNYEFQEAARKEVLLVVTNPKPATAIQEELYQKAQDLGLPLDVQQIRVDSDVVTVSAASLDDVMSETGGDPKVDRGTVRIEVSYAVPVRFPGYTLQLRFHVHADDKNS